MKIKKKSKTDDGESNENPKDVFNLLFVPLIINYLKILSTLISF